MQQRCYGTTYLHAQVQPAHTHTHTHICLMLPRTFTNLYTQRTAQDNQEYAAERERKRLKKALEYSSSTHALLASATAAGRPAATSGDGFKRMANCRKALEALDRRGWERSYHQRYFHDHFIRACARVFWKVIGSVCFQCMHNEKQPHTHTHTHFPAVHQWLLSLSLCCLARCRWTPLVCLPRTTRRFWS